MNTRSGSFIHVSCVQELAKEQLATVPLRYVHSDQELPITCDPSLLPGIPVIDLQNLLSRDSRNSELLKLHSACKEWGFFQLINHGVSFTLMETVKVVSKGLFELPLEEKEKLWQDPGDLQGFGQHFVVSNEQKHDWADIFFLIASPTYLTKLDLYSKLPHSFRDTMDAYSLHLRNICTILGQREKALKIARTEEITEMFEEMRKALRLNYYPPCPQPDLVMGLTPHSDGGGLTILLQLSEVDGLLVKKDGVWIPIKPLSNAFVGNIGDQLEIITNGVYQSIEHRATIDKKKRLTLATFHSPNLNGYLCPALNLVSPETPALFRRISVAKFNKRHFSRKLQGKSSVEAMRIIINEGQEN